MPETINRSQKQIETVLYNSRAEMEKDIENRERQGWEVIDVKNSSFSGGCIGCIGFIPIVIPLGIGKSKYRVTYRK